MSNTSANINDEFTLKEKITYTILGIVVIGGSFFIGRSIVRRAKADNEERKTFEDGSAATYAKQIKMAFENDGWGGTDEEALRSILRKIASKEDFKNVLVSYERLYNSSMMRDMKDELQATEYNEMLAIIAAKPDRIIPGKKYGLTAVQYQSWARRLKAAFDISYGPFPGTDEPAIKAVFLEIPTQADFQKVARAYTQEYARDLITDLKSELEFWEYSPMMKIIEDKPKM
jgi:hypothetical protein